MRTRPAPSAVWARSPSQLRQFHEATAKKGILWIDDATGQIVELLVESRIRPGSGGCQLCHDDLDSTERHGRVEFDDRNLPRLVFGPGERARREASAWFAFYYVGKIFYQILEFHGWSDEKNAILNAFRSMDPERMSNAISARMWDEVLALVGTPDEVRRQWQEISKLARNILLLAPAPYGGLSFERYRDNYQAILRSVRRSQPALLTYEVLE